jgi:hypothetical protein
MENCFPSEEMVIFIQNILAAVLMLLSTGIMEYDFRSSARLVQNRADEWNLGKKGKFVINLTFCFRKSLTNRQFSNMMCGETSRMSYDSLSKINNLFESLSLLLLIWVWYNFLSARVLLSFSGSRSTLFDARPFLTERISLE